MSRPLTLQEAAYAAGFFDGEGCISIAFTTQGTRRGDKYWPRERYFLSISLSQNDPAPIHWLIERFGGNARFVRGKRTYDKGYYERWNWVIGTEAAHQFLKTIRPFLIVKASQADIAFEFVATIGKNRRKTPPEIQEQRKSLRQRMKDEKHAFLNAKAS